MNKQESKDNKDKLRVYEYAKSLNMSSKEIITILKRLNIPVNNHMSVMENNAVNHVEQFFRDIKANAAAKRAASESVASKPAQTQSQAPKLVQEKPLQPKVEEKAQTAGSAAAAAQTPAPVVQTSVPVAQTTTAPVVQTSAPVAQTSAPINQSINTSHPQSNTSQPTRDRNSDQRPSGPRNPQSERQGHMNSTKPNNSSSNNASRPTSQQRPSQGSSNNQQRSSQPNKFAAQKPASNNFRPANSTAPQQKPVDTEKFEVVADTIASPASKTTKKTKPAGKRFDDAKPASGGNSNYKGNNSYNKNRGNQRGRYNQVVEKKEKIDNTPKKIIVRGNMTVGEMAKSLHKDASEVIKKLMFLGIMATINQELDLDAIQLLASEFKVEVEVKIPVEEDNFEDVEETDEDADLLDRAPVVTIMGHVDHGKTTLLDAIRETNVTGGEAGGITQHIGAYQVEAKGKKITFLDTPGHEAFTSMRARGAQVTDITILVVAADDGVMPQTIEAINHAKAAKVPIIVAINKIDKEGADPDRIKQDLTAYELVPEEWGGDTIFVPVSAKQRIGLDELLETILLVAEVNEYKANPNKRARGTVIEAELDKGRGSVARVLIQHGTLRVGDAFVAGVCFGRVRTMVNDKGRRLKEAGPSTPIEITGLTEVPSAGDPFIVFEDERKARAIADRRSITLRQSELGANTRVTLDDLYQQMKDGEMKELNVIIKADVHGSSEALRSSLLKIDVEGARVKILHSGVGAITESDIVLAAASNAIIIGFNVRPESAAMATAEQEKVDIRLHRVIYSAIEEIEAAMKGLLDPIFKESIIGHAEVRNLFKVTKVGTIAGCMITSGKITRSSEARIIRGGIVVFEGKIDTLKRFKDDVKEVAQGYECGITLERFNDIREGDVIEAFVMETVER